MGRRWQCGGFGGCTDSDADDAPEDEEAYFFSLLPTQFLGSFLHSSNGEDVPEWGSLSGEDAIVGGCVAVVSRLCRGCVAVVFCFPKMFPKML